MKAITMFLVPCLKKIISLTVRDKIGYSACNTLQKGFEKNIFAAMNLTVTENRCSLIYNASTRHMRHECNTRNANVTRAQNEQHEWKTSETKATQVRHKCDTSVPRTTRARDEWKNFDCDNCANKIIFHIPIFTIWQMKDYAEKNNFNLSTTLLPCQNAFEQCTTKIGLCNGKSYIKTLYTRL